MTATFKILDILGFQPAATFVFTETLELLVWG